MNARVFRRGLEYHEWACVQDIQDALLGALEIMNARAFVAKSWPLLNIPEYSAAPEYSE